MKKNDIIPLTIQSVSLEGSGVGYFDGMAVFVPFTAVGDELSVRVVKVQKTYAFGIVDKVITPGEGRITPDCGVFGKCGGCDFRHLDYSAERNIKHEAVRQVLRRIGGVEDPNVEEIVGGNRLCGFRNKAQYPAVLLPDGRVSFGFFAKRSHRVIPVHGCLLQNKNFDRAIEVVSRWADQNCITVYDETTRRGLLRHIFLRYAEKTDQLMVMPVINGSVPPSADSLAEALKNEMGHCFHTLVFNINKKDTNVVLGDKCVTVWGDGCITDTVCGIRLRISPLAFSQTNRDMAELLYQKAAELVPENNRVLIDIYCGGGAIGLSMAQKTEKLIGVEIVPQAVEDARFNARINGIENAEFICADAARAAEQLKNRGIRSDCVILDPPRKGCEEALLTTVANSFCPGRIVYISCNPATLARDTKVLSRLGYRLVNVTPFDLFPRTAHVETVACFDKQ